ncbi:MAG TPA: type I-C CRISPR-associated protein Cas8c/Csd1, partial [Betaproteobacteria bacterium]|nr:type I-C CRISPR-associated protein Cas8c/Csd1 [Betaproteobacteria bacterium]
MILQALNDYYDRKAASPNTAERLPAFGLEEKEIPFILEITHDGQLVQIADTRTMQGKKKIGQRFLAPMGVKKTSGVAANLLWDNAGYVLGIDAKGKPERATEQKAAFRARIEALPPAAKEIAGVRAVLAFLDGIETARLEKEPAWGDILESNPLLTFRLHGETELICQHPDVAAAAAGPDGEEAGAGLCLITGRIGPVERLHTAIKGVWGAQTSGANIVSFNLDAFNSYGKSQGANAPVGKRAAFAYTTALNHLLARDSRQRVQVGDASTVFWAEKQDEFEDLFGNLVRDDPDAGAQAMKALFDAVHSGKYATPEGGTRFYVLGLAPNAARIAIRFWHVATVREMAAAFARHFEDLRVARGPNDPEYLSLSGILKACHRRKSDGTYDIPPNLGGDVMRAVLAGTSYPA